MRLFHPHSWRPLLLTGALALTLLIVGACQQKVVVIGIAEPDQSASTLSMRDGFLEVLKEGGYKAGENLRVQRRDSAFRKQSQQQSVTELIDQEHSELVYVMGQDGLEAALAAKATVPVVFAGCQPCARQTHPANVTGAALATTNSDLHANGRQAGEAALRIIKGEKPSAIPVVVTP